MRQFRAIPIDGKTTEKAVDIAPDFVYGNLIVNNAYDLADGVHEPELLRTFIRERDLIWLNDPNNKCWTHREYEVIPETVGQNTGLKDKNGKSKEVYQGDRVFWGWNKEHRKIEGVIEWDKEQLAWVITNYYFQNNRKVLLANHPEIEIIGNVIQNPQLLENTK